MSDNSNSFARADNGKMRAANESYALKMNIIAIINNGTKDFYQNFKLYTFLVKIHQDLNFETKIVGIR